MKTLILLFLMSAFSSAKAYEVENGKQQGFEVIADNLVYIITPSNEKIQITRFPFVGPDYSMPPIEPIICTWDPSHTWLGIFITLKKVTEIHLFNMRTNSLLEAKTDWSKYPAWFSEPQWFVHEKPVRWSGNKLFIDALVKIKDGGTKRLSEIIIINGDEFDIVPQPDSGK